MYKILVITCFLVMDCKNYQQRHMKSSSVNIGDEENTSELLLEHQNINSIDANGKTILDYLDKTSPKVKLLRQQGALTSKEKNLVSAIIKQKNIKFLDKFVDEKELEYKDISNRNLLHIAASVNNIETSLWLINKKPSLLFELDNENLTPQALHMRQNYKYIEMINNSMITYNNQKILYNTNQNTNKPTKLLKLTNSNNNNTNNNNNNNSTSNSNNNTNNTNKPIELPKLTSNSTNSNTNNNTAKKEFTDTFESQKRAMKYATDISVGIQKGDRSLVFKGMQLLDKISIESITNRRTIMEKLLEALTSKALEWENYGIKRYIAKLLRKYIHGMYSNAKKHKRPIHVKDKTEIIAKIQKSLDLIDEETAPGNGLRYELDIAQSMVAALPDTNSFWDIWGEGVMDLIEFFSSKSISKLKTLASTIYKQMSIKYNRDWYEVVLYIDYLKNTALTDISALEKLQELLYIYRNKPGFLKFNPRDCRGDWHIIYTGIEALTYIIENSKNKKITSLAFDNTEKKKPGLKYYTDYNKLRNILNIKQNNWRIREKTIESLILLSTHKDKEIAKKSRKILLLRQSVEENSKVRLMLTHPECILAVQEAMKKDWTTYKTGFEKLFLDQKRDFAQIFKKLLETNKKEKEETLKAENKEIQKTKEVSKQKATVIKPYLKQNKPKFHELMTNKSSTLEEEIADGNNTLKPELEKSNKDIKNISEEGKSLAIEELQLLMENIYKQHQKILQIQVKSIQDFSEQIVGIKDVLTSVKEEMKKQGNWDIKIEKDFDKKIKKIEKSYKKVQKQNKENIEEKEDSSDTEEAEDNSDTEEKEDFSTYHRKFDLFSKVLSNEVEFIQNLSKDFDKKEEKNLWKYINDSKKDPKVSIAAANAMTILNTAGWSFSGEDLKGIQVATKINNKWRGPNLAGGIFEGTNLEKADLRGANLESTWLAKANLKNANLSYSQLAIPRTISGHSSWVTSVAISKDGKYIVSGSYDNTIKLWEISSGKCIKGFSWHIDGVNSVSISSDGKYIVSGSSDKTIKLWEIGSGKCMKDFRGHAGGVFSVSISNDGKYIVSGSEDKTIKLWEISRGKCIKTFTGHKDKVNSVAISKDGKYIVSGSDDSTIKLWEISSGKCRDFIGHKRWVFSVSISNDGKYIVSGSDDKTIKLWEISSGKCVKDFSGHTEQVNSVSISSDGKYIVSGSDDKTIKLWEISSGKCIKDFSGHENQVLSVSISNDGKYIVSGSDDKTIKLWEISSGKCIKDFSGHSSWVTSVAIFKDGKYIVSGSRDHTIKLWEISSGKCIKDFIGHTAPVQSVSISKDGKYIVSGSWDKTIKLWEISSGKWIKDFSGYTNRVNSVSISKDGKYIVSGSDDSTIKLWEISSGRCIKDFSGHKDEIYSVSISKDGKYIVSGSRDNTIKLWEISSGKCIKDFSGHTGWVNSVSISSDGKYIVSGSYDSTIKLWEISSGKWIKDFSGHKYGVRSVSISNDGKYIVSGSCKTIKLWEISSGKCIKDFSGHSSWVTSVAISKDGKYIVSGSDDCTIRTWRISDGVMINCFGMPGASFEGTNLQGVNGLEEWQREELKSRGAKF